MIDTLLWQVVPPVVALLAVCVGIPFLVAHGIDKGNEDFTIKAEKNEEIH